MWEAVKENPCELWRTPVGLQPGVNGEIPVSPSLQNNHVAHLLCVYTCISYSMQDFVLPKNKKKKKKENASPPPPQVGDATEGSSHRCQATVVGLGRSVICHLLGPETRKLYYLWEKKKRCRVQAHVHACGVAR